MLLQVLFWVSVLVLFFTYVGYPLFLAFLAPLRKQPVIRTGLWEPNISIIIPARNEAAHIENKLRNCANLDYPQAKMEIILVDDGSDDDTLARARRCQIPGLQIVALSHRMGKWAAMNRGVLEAAGDILVFTDADSLIAPDSLRFLLRPFVNPIVGCVAGRYQAGGLKGSNACAVGFYWRYEDYLRNKESQVGGLLGASGSLYALRSELYEPLTSGLINDDFIIPMLASSKNFRTLYEPRAVATEDESHNAEVEFARRVRIMAGNCQHLYLFRHLLLQAFVSRLGFQLFCHKFLRVVSPLFLFTAFFTAAALQNDPIYATLLAAQFAFYGASAFGYLIRPSGRFAFLVNLPRYFVMLNLTALLGIYYFLFRYSIVPWGEAARNPASLLPDEITSETVVSMAQPHA